MSKRRVVLCSPDRGQVYDGRTLDARGVGGGITARLSMLGALAAEGHDVTAYVNTAERVVHAGVQYLPLDELSRIDTEILIAMSTGGFSFSPLRSVPINAALRIVWVQGVPKPSDLDVVAPDFVYAASNFLRRVCIERWGLPASRLFVCYNGLRQEAFEEAEARGIRRDPFGMAYIGPPEKGLAASLEVLRLLRIADARFHLDIFGGGRLWGRGDEAPAPEPGLTFHGMLGQAALVPRLFEYEYLLAPQAPHMEEGFGIAVQEAKRAGMIAIVSEVGAFAELMRHGQDGFLVTEPHDTAACHDRMAQLILELSRDPDRRARVRANALGTPWSWTTSARTWTSHWDYVLGERGAASTGGFLDLPDGRHNETTGEFIPAAYPSGPS
jgi:glycosyltransferase involved in cell wall biosynthesis